MRQLDNWIDERTLNSELKKADEAYRFILADPLSTESTRKEARTKVEKLRLLKLTLHSNRAQAILID